MLRAYPAPTSTGLSKELVTPVRSRARSCGNGRLDPESSLGDVYLKRVYLCIHTYTSYIYIGGDKGGRKPLAPPRKGVAKGVARRESQKGSQAPLM